MFIFSTCNVYNLKLMILSDVADSEYFFYSPVIACGLLMKALKKLFHKSPLVNKIIIPQNIVKLL